MGKITKSRRPVVAKNSVKPGGLSEPPPVFTSNSRFPPHAEIILNSIAKGVFTIDLEWHVTFFNRAAQEDHILSSEGAVSASNTFKVAIPVAEGRLCNHFGHCQQFAVIQINAGLFGGTELHTPPPHEPGVLPQWLGNLGVSLVIAGGMGQRALSLLAEKGIKVITGSPSQEPEALVKSYLAGALVNGPNVCDH